MPLRSVHRADADAVLAVPVVPVVPVAQVAPVRQLRHVPSRAGPTAVAMAAAAYLLPVTARRSVSNT